MLSEIKNIAHADPKIVCAVYLPIIASPALKSDLWIVELIEVFNIPSQPRTAAGCKAQHLHEYWVGLTSRKHFDPP